MPPKIFSRHEFTLGVRDAADNLILTEREPFRFQSFGDNVRHTVREGDTLFTLADLFFDGLTERPAGLWWVIADFQPDPILDPTLELEPGRVMIIPSVRTVREEVFNPRRALL